MSARKQCFQANPRVTYIKVGDIQPNPAQPRKIFDRDALMELAASIEQHGVLQPLTVRRTETGVQLVAGERRLRAAKLVGLTEVPCLFLEISGQQSSLFALIENLQRKDLDYIEEAEGLAKLMRLYGLSQDEVAKRVGKSQPTVANKLRLLKLSPTTLLILRENCLTERHARALLRLEKEEQRLAVLEQVVAKQLNVAKTEALIDKLTEKNEQQREKARCTYVFKDIKIFMNTINHSLEVMRDAGVDADIRRTETEDEILLAITIPKLGNRSAKGA